jgi:dTDP-L-rhamnose 4-epimerase
MGKQILVTGGAGFIGSHLADRLLAAGHRVRALDNLSPQVHGPEARRPAYLADDVELQVGDVRDPAACRQALRGVDVVYHLAAAVGVGQSMYQIARYTDVNNLGTATLLEVIAATGIERLVIASSMSVYGEGLYRGGDGAVVADAARTPAQLREGRWEVLGPGGEPLEPLPTPEGKAPALASVYALGKYDQERLGLIVARAYGIPAVALRFFNVYGPRQALSNPYTGVLAIFASRLLNERPPLINEDGLQRRDFVSVHDVARACLRALEVEARQGLVLNLGSGAAYTVREIAERVARALGKSHITPAITGNFRMGDIRHCYADISAARRVLGYEPRVSLEEGLEELAGWLEGQAAVDEVEAAREELMQRGLAI